MVPGMKERTVQCPTHLTAHSRAEFRDAALGALGELGDRPGGVLVIDLSATDKLDSAGLGTLVMLQLRAAERRHTVRLVDPSEEIRFLLLMTRLEERFEFDPPR